MYLTELPTLSNGLIDHGSVSLSSLNPDDRRRAFTSWTTKQQQKEVHINHIMAMSRSILYFEIGC